MDKAAFLSKFTGLYTDLREQCHATIYYQGVKVAGPGEINTSGSMFLGSEILARFDADTCALMLDMLKDIRDSARKCQEVNEVPTTNPKADCTPIITIDNTGVPSCKWRK